MTRALLVLLAFVSTSAFAHVHIGFYDGQNADGSACSFEVKSVEFEGGVRSPYNERVTVAYGGGAWVLSHPATVDADAPSLNFDHGKLTAVRGVRGGAHGIVIHMDHSEGNDGPGSLTFVSDVTPTGRDAAVKGKWACSGLRFRQ